MQAPKRKKSKSRRDMRRGHDRMEVRLGSVCRNCGEPVLPHSVCMACGYYRGRLLVSIDAEAR